MLSELTPTDWAVKQLLADPELFALVRQRIDHEDNVPEMLETETPGDYFPRITYSGTPHGTPWATMLDLGWGEFTFKAVMREDALPPGVDFKEFTRDIAASIERVLVAANEPGVLGDLSMIHGASIVDLHAPPIYGPQDKRICERGRVVRIDWS